MGFINLDFGGGKDRCLNKLEVAIVDKSAEEPDEGLIVLVIAFGGNVVILQILLTVEVNLLSLDLAVLHVNFVSDQDNWDALADAGEIFIPLGHIGVRDPRAHVEHDNSAVTTDVIAVAESSKLLLTCSVPDIELDLPVVGKEGHGMYLHTESGNVLFLELSSHVTFHKGSFSDATVTDQDELELRNLLCLIDHLKYVL
jgi:hypothetical protein